MKRLVLTLALAALGIGYTAAAGAQSSPPALPSLTADQSAEVQRQLDLYRTEVDGRVSRGEITAEEAVRLLKWRQWQLAQQATQGMPPGPISDAPPISASDVSTPPDYSAPPARQAVAPPVRQYVYAPPPTVVYPAPYYYPPYYAPYYAAPRPYYWGSVCAGGWGHHFGARFCL